MSIRFALPALLGACLLSGCSFAEGAYGGGSRVSSNAAILSDTGGTGAAGGEEYTYVIEAHETHVGFETPHNVNKLIVNGGQVLQHGIQGREEESDYVHVRHLGQVSGGIDLGGGHGVVIIGGYEDGEPYDGGAIIGDIQMGDAHDVIVVNDGTLHDINTGDGHDLVMITGGAIRGDIDLGNGHSTLEGDIEAFELAMEAEPLLLTAPGDDKALLEQVRLIEELELRHHAWIDVAWLRGGEITGAVRGGAGTQLFILGDFANNGARLMIDGNIEGGVGNDGFVVLGGSSHGIIDGGAGDDVFVFRNGAILHANGGDGDDIFHLHGDFTFLSSAIDECGSEGNLGAAVICGGAGHDALIYTSPENLPERHIYLGIEEVILPEEAQLAGGLAAELASLERGLALETPLEGSPFTTREAHVQGTGAGRFALANLVARAHYAYDLNLARTSFAHAITRRSKTSAALHHLEGNISSGDVLLGLTSFGASAALHWQQNSFAAALAMMGTWFAAMPHNAENNSRAQAMHGTQSGLAASLSMHGHLGAFTFTPKLALSGHAFNFRQERAQGSTLSRTPFLLTGEAGMRVALFANAPVFASRYGLHQLEAIFMLHDGIANEDESLIYASYQQDDSLNLQWESLFSFGQTAALSLSGNYRHGLGQTSATDAQARFALTLAW